MLELLEGQKCHTNLLPGNRNLGKHHTQNVPLLEDLVVLKSIHFISAVLFNVFNDLKCHNSQRVWEEIVLAFASSDKNEKAVC